METERLAYNVFYFVSIVYTPPEEEKDRFHRLKTDRQDDTNLIYNKFSFKITEGPDDMWEPKTVRELGKTVRKEVADKMNHHLLLLNKRGRLVRKMPPRFLSWAVYDSRMNDATPICKSENFPEGDIS